MFGEEEDKEGIYTLSFLGFSTMLEETVDMPI